MVVDDEMVIRNGISSMVDWGKWGIEIVGEAANGREALKMALLLRPDIVFTDIKMPIVDGISFAKELSEKYPGIYIVFLTGYSDFEYTKQAIQIGAADYLLKPICMDDLEKLIKRLKERIASDYDKKVKQLETYQMLASNMPILRGLCYENLMTGKMSAKEFIKEAERLSIPIPIGETAAIFIDIDDYEQIEKVKSNQTIIRYSVLNIAEEIFAHVGTAVLGYLSNDSTLLGSIDLKNSTMGMLVDACQQLQFYLWRFSYFTVTISIGCIVQSGEKMRESLCEANKALKQKFFIGKNQIIFEEQSGESRTEQTILVSNTDENTLKEILSVGNYQNSLIKLEQILNRYLNNEAYTERAIRQFAFYLIWLVKRTLLDMRMDEKEIFGNDSNILEEIDSFKTVGELRLFIKNVYSKIFAILESQRTYKKMVRQCIDYIRSHFGENIHVADMANLLHVTPNYFSKIFKQETGENFTEWLNKYRIEQAKEMLIAASDDKIYEIAGKTGFSDYKYFSYVFKKQTGYTPGTFRQLHQ